MATLLAIVVLLFMTGLQGFYAYRHAAHAISDRAAEIPMAYRVAQQSAELLRVTHELAKPGDDLPTREHFRSDRLESFRQVCSEFKHTLEVYQARLATNNDPAGLLDDRTEEIKTVTDLQQMLQLIQFATILNFVTTQSTQKHVIQLDEMAQKLPMIFQQRMANFREEIRGEYRAWTMIAWTCGSGAISLLIGMWWFFRRTVLQPFRQLMRGCRLIGNGDFDQRIHLKTADELAELAQALNSMTDRFQQTLQELQQTNADLDQEVRERTNEVIRNEQLASVGFLAAGVSHEINNPMAAIAWSAEALEARLHNVLTAKAPVRLDHEQIEALRENLQRIQQEAFRCKEITDRLLDFSRLGEVRPARTELRTLVRDVAAIVGNLGEFRSRSIQVDAPDEVFAMVHGQEIKQVVLNLLTNGLQSLDGGGTVVVRVWRDLKSARITVQDNGRGMTDEVRQHLFEPFFTRRPDGRGTGLGLSISYRIVQQHGGRLTAHSDGPGAGTRMDVQLPLAEGIEVFHEQRTAA